MTIDWTKRIRVRHLEILVELANSGNISLTADSLNMTQPGISRWLKELEDDIGLPLFERHTRGLRLTAHGEALLHHAKIILNQLDITKKDLNSRKNEGSGIVNIGITGAVTTDFAPKVVTKLLDIAPNIQIALFEGTMDSLLNRLHMGNLDIVIGRSPQHLLATDIEHEILYTEPFRFIVNLNHPLLKKQAIEWDEVYQYPWIIWPQNTPLRQDLEMALMAEKRTLPEKYVESNSLNLNIQLLSLQNFISVVSLRTARRFEHIGIIKILDIFISALGSVSVFRRKDSMQRPAVKKALLAIKSTV